MKTVVAEEDRSRNLLVFGLPDDEEEQLEERISEVLETVGQEPKLKMEAQRLSKKKTSTSTRPVKVRLSSSFIVHQILDNLARKLRLSAKFKTVFLSPD